MIKYPLPGETYQHFKGGIYKVITLANSCDDMTPLVVYQNQSFGTTYVRKLEEWNEIIPSSKESWMIVDTPRFKRL